MLKPLSKLEPDQDQLLSYADVGRRQRCHPLTAKRRMLAGGVPIVRINSRVHAVRLSDLLAYEEKASA
jgi:hypothetical protein